MNYNIICSVYETSNVYNSVILCSDSNSRFLFEQMILDDYPVQLYKPNISQNMIEGDIRCIIVSEQDYEDFLVMDWQLIKELVTLVFYDKPYSSILPPECSSTIKMY